MKAKETRKDAVNEDQAFEPGLLRRKRHIFPWKAVATGDKNRLPADHSPKTLAGSLADLGCSLGGKLGGAGGVQYGLRQRMTGVAFEAGRGTQNLVFSKTRSAQISVNTGRP